MSQGASPARDLRNAGRKPRLSVVVPCYNEEAGLAALHEAVTRVCAAALGSDYELVLVDDGSRDNTWPLVKALTMRDPRVVGVSLSRNHGHQLALSAGLTICRGERVLVLDADLQDPPELLPEMMRLMDEGADVVYGQRVERQGETWFKRASASVFYRLLGRMVDIEIPVDAGDFRLMSRRVVDLVNGMPEGHRFIRGMISWLGFRQVALPYQRQARVAGVTHYPLRKMLRFALDAITSFSIRPLRIASWLGVVSGCLGLVGILYVLQGWLSGEAVAGWTSVMMAVMLMGGLQLIVIGVFGEYLGRLYIETKRRPLFLIDRVECSAQTGEERAVPIPFHQPGGDPAYGREGEARKISWG